MASSLSKKGTSSNSSNNNNKGSALVYGIPAPRKLKKAFSNFALTAACGFITILVLRGSTGFNELNMLSMLKTEQGLEIGESNARRFVSVSRAQQQVYQMKKEDEKEITIDLAKVQSQSAHLLQQQEDETKSMALSNPPAYIFLPRVQNWDEERQRYINKGSSRHLHSHQPSVLLVTGSPPSPCHHPNGDHYRTKFLKNKMDYSRLHDLDIFYNLATLDSNLGSGQWSKLPLLHNLMIAHPDTEWLWWIDSDSIFTDMSFHLKLENYQNTNLVLFGNKELVYAERSWIGLSTGSFLIRNCQWSLDLLDAWAAMAPEGKIRTEFGALLTKVLKGRPNIEADDQSSIIYLLTEQNSKWADQVHFEDPLFLQEYWAVVDKNDPQSVDKMFTPSEGHTIPFITHFVGCRPCNIYNKELESCLKHMERAYNFADNQVLQFYGFRHDDLSSHRLTSISV